MSTEKNSNKKNRKRAMAIGLVGIGVAGIAAASASTLAVTAGGKDNVAGGSTNVSVSGPGLTDVKVDLSRTATPDAVWNINENWPAGANTAAATLTNFNTSGGAAVPGIYKVAVFDTATGGTGTHAAIATGEVTASAAGATSLTAPLALGTGATWADVLTKAKSVTVVFQAA